MPMPVGFNEVGPQVLRWFVEPKNISTREFRDGQVDAAGAKVAMTWGIHPRISAPGLGFSISHVPFRSEVTYSQACPQLDPSRQPLFGFASIQFRFWHVREWWVSG